MFTSILKGYSVAFILGVAGSFVIGGPIWVWFLFVWIAGAPITLFFSDLFGQECSSENLKHTAPKIPRPVMAGSQEAAKR